MPHLLQIGKYCLWTSLIFFTVSIAAKEKKEITTKSYSSTSPEAIDLYEKALQLYHQKSHQQAIETLEKAHAIDKNFVEVYVQLATLYRDVEDFGQTINQLKQAEKALLHRKIPYLRYEIAQLYYRSGCYAKARSIADSIIPAELPSTTYLVNLQILQHNLTFALEQIKYPIKLAAKKLPSPLNLFTSQYFPILTIDEKTIFFTALDEHYKENIYVSHKDSLGQWSLPQSISEQINQPTGNEGTCTISADKKTLIFTACSQQNNHGTCDLYITHQIGENWSTPQNLGPHVNGGSWQSQPSLSADGKTLYFVSERPGNYGRNDIWKTTLQENQEWSDPVNLGPPINSKGREVSPFIHPNGQTLFFASDRTPSMGGFDLYYSNYINGQWTQPINLGYPINDHKDQISIFITADGKRGYYAEGNRKNFNYQGSHLYEFTIPDGLLKMPKSNLLKLKVIDATNQTGLQVYASVYNMTADSLQQGLVTESDGEINLVVNEGTEYLLAIQKEGYMFENKKITYPVPTNLLADTISLNPLQLNDHKVLDYVFFEYDDYQLTPASYPELNELVNFLQKHPTICIKLEGHTDSNGSEDYNKVLSTKRAATIYHFLISKGIDASRLTYEGYGKSKPLVANDSPQNRHINRRVAFNIIKL